MSPDGRRTLRNRRIVAARRALRCRLPGPEPALPRPPNPAAAIPSAPVPAHPLAAARAIEAAVSEAEGATAAEIVVVCAPQSGTYNDLAWGVGALVSFLALAFVVFSPFALDPIFWPLEVPLLGCAMGWLAARTPGLCRLAPAQRRAAQVRVAAEAAFYQEKVFATQGRIGVLVYISWAESQALVIPDEGLLGRIPGEAWPMVGVDPGSIEGVAEGIKRLGQILAAHVPRESDDANELPNAPVMR